MNRAAGSTKSEQVVGTPQKFITAVNNFLNREPILDLCAIEKNKKAPNFISPEQDSLNQEWHKYWPYDKSTYFWLNPPFNDCKTWLKKAYKESQKGPIIASLTPASVGSTWYRECVRGKCLSLFLESRMTFEGHNQSFPKDLMLCVWQKGLVGGGTLNWRAYL